MALTGIDIFKKLPKTNCGDCGVPTCLAFAMKLAAGQAELDACPHVSDEAKAELSEASAPPIRPVKLGVADDALTVGGETVLFRHEKTFVNSPGIAILVTDDMDDAEVGARIDRLNNLKYDRVGLLLEADLVAAKCVSGEAAKYEALVKKIVGQTEKSLVLVCEDTEIMSVAVAVCADRKPLLYAATKDNVDAMVNLAKNNACPLAVRAESLADLPELTEKITAAGVKDLVIDPGSRSVRGAFQDEIVIRRAALVQKYQPLGFPTITLPCEMTDDPMKETVIAATLIAKYAGIIVMSDLSGETLFPLLLGRMNIYTDPQRPMATEEGIYEIGGPTADSPVLITTNFSLTYFIVSGEVETSRVPTWLLIKDCEGLSVMTAWAAGKFVADAIAPMVTKCGITDKISHRKLIIPGYAAAISGEMEEELPDWNIQIGPREASHLPAYLKEWSA